MPSHEPPNYACPFCRMIRGAVDSGSHDPGFVGIQGEAAVLIGNRWWPNNLGHELVVPTLHVENLYEIPRVAGHAVQDLVQQVAIAMRNSYGCDGISTRQHNEPAGGQDVWHLHVHVFPRYVDDHLYSSKPLPGVVSDHDRASYATKLRSALGWST